MRFSAPLNLITLLACCLAGGHPLVPTLTAAETDGEYLDFNYGQATGGDEWIQSIRVTKPACRDTIQGDVTVEFEAPGMTVAKAMCWQQPTTAQPDPWGHDVELTDQPLVLSPTGKGSFVFHGDEFPNGPIAIRIHARNPKGKQDIFELQLFNAGGVKWNQGIPSTSPPAAAGLSLVFADDFDGPLSISNDGRGARYSAHKPGGGDFSGWQFSDVRGEGKPFAQRGTWLCIAARKDAESPKGRSGLIASVDQDFKGFWAKAPTYLECRFIAQSAPGTWPAFWTLTHRDPGQGGDELDIIEAYGGLGKGHPNQPGYAVTSHFWRQTNADGSKKKGFGSRIPIRKVGGGSYWSSTFHTYAVLITEQDTVYYCDDIEVYRHPTNDLSWKKPHSFLINYAIGGLSGWPIDLKRYQNGSDMWVDYVRVYAKETAPEEFSKPGTTPVSPAP